MFQYAVGRSLALKKGCALKLDVQGFSNYGLHQGFELDRVFNCAVDFASQADINSVLKWQAPLGIRRVLARRPFRLIRRDAWFCEPGFSYSAKINELPDTCYLSGYWQSERYFGAYAQQIRKDFTFSIAPSLENQRILEKIRSVNAVSVHVRRGDYLKSKANLDLYGVCSIEYYRNAIALIRDKIEDPYFLIFADDMDWIRDQLGTDENIVYIDHNRGSESFNDMRLMSACSHHIIANSTFSWWGAWLGSNENKIVVAPEPWFNSKRMDTRDLIPKPWQLVSKNA